MTYRPNDTDVSHQDLLDVQELALLLKVSPYSIYRLVQRRLIPFHRPRRKLLFARVDVEAYLQKCRIGSVDEIYGS